jgi:predicted transcriptional regulator
MENSGYSTLPIINIDGKYIGTISEGDILSYFKSLKVFNLKDAEKVPLTKIERKRNYSSIRINSKMSDLLNLSKKENFIPVVDDRDMFIGIITRQDIIDYFYKNNLGDIYE